MLEQMEQIMRMREQQRNNMRLIRQREQQALRDFERARQQQQANRVMGLPAPPPAQYPHLPPAPFQVYGNPQAVPEPLPFLEVVENHGRNIHIVQQQRMPFIAGPAAGGQQVGQPPAIPPPPLQHQQVRLPPNMGQQRQHGAAGHQHRQHHHHHRDLTAAQRDRERRNREEAIIRLRRNREEVLRRQRRHHDRARFHQNGEVRVERVPNTYPDQAQPEQQERQQRPNREAK